MRLRSLRGRVLVGSIFWSFGLFILITMVLTHLFEMRDLQFWMHIHRVFQAPVVITMAVVSLALGLMHARKSVAALNNLRSRMASLHSGRERRMDGTYPSEVQPLVDDLNSLLDHRERAVERAIAKAGDLAHGLKTPLAILAREAERARAAGQTELAEAVEQQVTRMRRQVDYHLAHARAVASGVTGAAPIPVSESAEGVARALRRLYAERGLTIEVAAGADAAVRVQREDLDEMLGNLVDNACKWARARVLVRAERSQRDGKPAVVVTVDDDGAGIAPDMRHAVLQRGVRADEAAPGSGLGLAIVRDLVELYDGSLVLDVAPMGGLSARLTLPA